MKKLLLLLSFFTLFTISSFGQRHTIEASPNAGFFMLDSVDYPQGHFEIQYTGRITIDTLRRFTLFNIHSDKKIISSRYFTDVTDVSSWDELSQLLEVLGVLNTINTDKPFNQQIAESLKIGYDTEFKFGQNALVGATEEVIWDAGGSYIFLTAAETMKVVSNEANDSIDGSGAHLVAIFGLNANYDETFQIISMDGVDTVQTDTAFLRVFRAVVLTSGTDSPTADANEGTITISASSTLTLQAQINPRNGQTLMCVYTVPRGKTAYITGISFGTGEGKECTFKGKFRNGVGGAFSVKYSLTLFQSAFFGDLAIPLRVPEKIDIVITGISGSAGTKADASFGFILKDN